MSEERLKEGGGTGLTMALIGCLPDNVQKAIRSFSIKPGMQHVTFAFPFMVELLREFHVGGSCSLRAAASSLTAGLFCDHSIDVVDGYHSFVTLAPTPNRETMPVVLFTLYEENTIEGIKRHFDSLVKILFGEKSSIKVWKMPKLVMDLSQVIVEQIVDVCSQSIVDIQKTNLLISFPGSTHSELLHIVKDKIIVPSFRTYGHHLECHMEEVVTQLQLTDPKYFLSMVELIRSKTCTPELFKKTDSLIKGSSTELCVKQFWQRWSQQPLACKVFPPVLSLLGTRQNSHSLSISTMESSFVKQNDSDSYTRFASEMPSMSQTGVQYLATAASMTNMPLKEGLHSIIKCLKAQATHKDGVGCDGGVAKLVSCCCNVCQERRTYHRLRTNPKQTDRKGLDILSTQSAFYHPRPAMMPGVYLTTRTPYSDALKAAADAPLVRPTHVLSQRQSRPMCCYTPYYLTLSHPYRPTLTTRTYPLVYRPRIITHNH